MNKRRECYFVSCYPELFYEDSPSDKWPVSAYLTLDQSALEESEVSAVLQPAEETD